MKHASIRTTIIQGIKLNMASKRNFDVKVMNEEVIGAALPIQEHHLQLSNLDLLLPPIHVGVFFCYKKSPAGAISVLKKSLAQTLVPYYVFAGEMVQNDAGEPEILCNNRGVDFVEALADVELQELNLYNPDESVEGKLVPLVKNHNGFLAVQATQLKCGGMVVGCTFDHRIADAYSFNMFMVSWAEMSRSIPLTTIPSFQRSSISPRHPPAAAATFDSNYLTKLFVPFPKQQLLPASSSQEGTDEKDQQTPISRIYIIKSEQVIHIQSWANNNNNKHNNNNSNNREGQINCVINTLAETNKRTKLEAFSAFLWKMVASGDGTGDNKTCRMGIVVDGRSRLSSSRADHAENNNNNNQEEDLTMSTYFGNVLTIPYGDVKNKELRERSLSWVANEVHEFIQNAASKDHFLELIDYVEAHRPSPMIAKIFVVPVSVEEPAFVVSSGQQFPVKKIEFGWGEPVFGSYHFPWGSKTGYVMPMASVKGNGDWVVYLHLAKEQIEVIERDASHIFIPLDARYFFV